MKKFSKTSAGGGRVVLASIIGVFLAPPNVKYSKRPPSLAFIEEAKNFETYVERLDIIIIKSRLRELFLLVQAM